MSHAREITSIPITIYVANQGFHFFTEEIFKVHIPTPKEHPAVCVRLGTLASRDSAVSKILAAYQKAKFP